MLGILILSDLRMHQIIYLSLNNVNRLQLLVASLSNPNVSLLQHPKTSALSFFCKILAIAPVCIDFHFSV